MDPLSPPESGAAASPADRVEFETLISDTSAHLIQAQPDELKAVIETALARFRTFFRAGRCALLTVSADRQVVNVFAASSQSPLITVTVAQVGARVAGRSLVS